MIDRDNRRMENIAYNAWDSINELLKANELPNKYRKRLKDANEILFKIEKEYHELWVKNEQMEGWHEPFGETQTR